MKKVRITWVKSQICTLETHRRTLRALGFHRLNETIEKELNPAVKGMVDQVSYLLKVEEVE
jgi:large subunit ribosomal protein L30